MASWFGFFAKPQPSQQVEKKFSSDADIDDFIDDLALLFHNKFITYVDVGAYVGEVLLKILDSKKIQVREAHLFEPNPDSYEKLVQAVSTVNVPACHTYHLAIGSEPGTASFLAAKSMTKRLRVDIGESGEKDVFDTECKSLDALSSLFTDGRINLMKLDVEGEEIDVLKGAADLLKEQKIDVIYVEVGMNLEGKQQTYLGDIDPFLQGYGYRAFKIYEQKNEWIDDSPLLRRANIAYLSNKFSQSISYKNVMQGRG